MPTSAEALRMRAAVCTLLGGPDPRAADAWRNVGVCSPVALDLLLRLERCALAVRGRLAELGLTQTTAPALLAVINSQATKELQRTLSGRAQLQRIARLAQEHGWKAIVLKGGVTIASGGQVHVQDIDVLMPPKVGTALAALLNTRGEMSPLHALHHLSPLYSDDAVTIEVHHLLPHLTETQELMERAVPLDGMDGLWQLAPVDHVWHMLVHTTIQHPERRGSLRDAVMIAQAISGLTSEEWTTAIQRIEAHAEAAALRPMFVFAREMAAKLLVTDPYARAALRKYTFCHRYDGRSTNLRERALRLLCTDRSFVHAVREDMSLTNEIPATFAPVNWLNRRIPWLGVGFRRALRLGRLTLATGLVVQNAWDVRRAVRERRAA